MRERWFHLWPSPVPATHVPCHQWCKLLAFNCVYLIISGKIRPWNVAIRVPCWVGCQTSAGGFLQTERPFNITVHTIRVFPFNITHNPSVPFQHYTQSECSLSTLHTIRVFPFNITHNPSVPLQHYTQTKHSLKTTLHTIRVFPFNNMMHKPSVPFQQHYTQSECSPSTTWHTN